MEYKHYVYLLVDPRDNRIFYIGKGTGDRMYDHEAYAIKHLLYREKYPSNRLYKIRTKKDELVLEIVQSTNEIRTLNILDISDDDVAYQCEHYLYDILKGNQFINAKFMNEGYFRNYEFNGNQKIVVYAHAMLNLLQTDLLQYEYATSDESDNMHDVDIKNFQ